MSRWVLLALCCVLAVCVAQSVSEEQGVARDLVDEDSLNIDRKGKKSVESSIIALPIINDPITEAYKAVSGGFPALAEGSTKITFNGGAQVACHDKTAMDYSLEQAGTKRNTDLGVKALYVDYKGGPLPHHLIQLAPPFDGKSKTWLTGSGYVEPTLKTGQSAANLKYRIYPADCFYNFGDGWLLADDKSNAATSGELASGCYPYRRHTKVIQTLMKCVDAVMSASPTTKTHYADKRFGDGAKRVISLTQENQEFLLRLEGFAYKAAKVGSSDWVDKYSLEAAIELSLNDDGTRRTTRRKIQFVREWPIYKTDGTFSVGWRVEDEEAIKACVNNNEVFEAMLCYPTMHGGTGMLEDFVAEHKPAWWDNTKVVFETKVHPVCARLAQEELVQFEAARYSHGFISNLGAFFRANVLPSWSGVCAAPTSGNCRTYSTCFALALGKVCAKHKNCCPTDEIYTACQADPGSSGCKAIVSYSGFANDAFLTNPNKKFAEN